MNNGVWYLKWVVSGAYYQAKRWIGMFEIFEISNNLYQSSAIRDDKDWKKIKNLGIDVIIDLEGNLDPIHEEKLDAYLYWPIIDEPKLPNLNMLNGIALFGKKSIDAGLRVLTHCSAGRNRSSLVNAAILKLLHPEYSGKAIVQTIKEAVKGSLSNQAFVDHIES